LFEKLRKIDTIIEIGVLPFGVVIIRERKKRRIWIQV
jgi:hypothetical protein